MQTAGKLPDDLVPERNEVLVNLPAAKLSHGIVAPVDDGFSIRGICKAFITGDKSTSVIEDVNLRIRQGQFVTLIGPSGCGKSTLLRIAAGLLTADRGSVSIFGETVSHAAQFKHIGFVPQTPALLPWRTVIENVELPLQVNRRGNYEGDRQPSDPRGLLESFGLGGVLDRRPHELSGGMQQRVAIARAFVFDPTLLLMDEPFSALDEFTREAQRRGLLELWQSNQKTVLFVTHSVAEAVELSDVIVVMSSQPGRIRAVIPVDLPRPRRDPVENSEAFHGVEAQVRRELRRTWVQSE
jgi:NitT/TauT family transport system ATP-binding protein